MSVDTGPLMSDAVHWVSDVGAALARALCGDTTKGNVSAFSAVFASRLRRDKSEAPT